LAARLPRRRVWANSARRRIRAAAGSIDGYRCADT
jgi:hypothetical protein